MMEIQLHTKPYSSTIAWHNRTYLLHNIIITKLCLDDLNFSVYVHIPQKYTKLEESDEIVVLLQNKFCYWISCQSYE